MCARRSFKPIILRVAAGLQARRGNGAIRLPATSTCPAVVSAGMCADPACATLHPNPRQNSRSPHRAECLCFRSHSRAPAKTPRHGRVPGPCKAAACRRHPNPAGRRRRPSLASEPLQAPAFPAPRRDRCGSARQARPCRSSPPASRVFDSGHANSAECQISHTAACPLRANGRLHELAARSLIGRRAHSGTLAALLRYDEARSRLRIILRPPAPRLSPGRRIPALAPARHGAGRCPIPYGY